MAEELRLVLIVLGVLGISALALHGWWTVRKNNKDIGKYEVEDTTSASRADGFDELGIGRKRVLQPGEKPQPKPAPTVAPAPVRGGILYVHSISLSFKQP